MELAVSNQELKTEIERRAEIEAALKKSERHYTQLLEESGRLQEQLRYLSRQILSAQEEERKRISRELHDRIAASLTGINLELSCFAKRSDRQQPDAPAEDCPHATVGPKLRGR